MIGSLGVFACFGWLVFEWYERFATVQASNSKPLYLLFEKKRKKPLGASFLCMFLCAFYFDLLLFIYSCESVCECVCGFIKIPFYLCLPPQSMLQQNTTFFPSTLCVLHISVRDKLLIRQEAEGSSYFHLAAD